MAYLKNIPYEIIPGHRRDAQLLWSPDEKYLYFRKKIDNGMEDWGCYQEMLRKKNPGATSCSARLSVDRSRPTCSSKSMAHSAHNNHELIYMDLISRNKIVDDCINLKNAVEGLSIDVPVADIFTRELAT